MSYPANSQPQPQPMAANTPRAGGQNMQPNSNYYDEQGRPRAQTSFSLHSHKSSGSHSAKLDESHAEKEARRLHTKADPSVAMNEAEPAAVAALQAVSMAPIRAIQHKDGLGNIISDPDKSNPTRNRFERPLDTIKSFEAAIDANYSRKSVYRTDNPDAGSQYGGGGYNSRRNSYYGNQGPMDDRSRHGGNNYYPNRSPNYRPDSYNNGNGNGNGNGSGNGNGYNQGYSNGYDAGPGPHHGNGYPPNRSRMPRTADPYGQAGYAPNGYGMPPQNYDSASGSGSASTPDPAGYQTDPSSENGSSDRIAPPHMLNHQGQPEGYGSPNMGYGAPQGYGYGGMGGDPQQQQQQQQQQPQYNAAQRMGNGYLDQGTPSQGGNSMATGQQPGGASPRPPIKLGNTVGSPPMTSSNARPGAGASAGASAEKRKSWLGRKLSRS